MSSENFTVGSQELSTYSSHQRDRNYVTRRASPQSRSRKLQASETIESTVRATPRRLRYSPNNSRRSRRLTQAANFIIWISLGTLCYHHVFTNRDARRTSIISPQIPASRDIMAGQVEVLSNSNATRISHNVGMGNHSGLIHIVHTRFMQNQPHLIDLGLARLKLLDTFCVSSLKRQTSQNFLWVIRTDPHLNATLVKPLLELLKGQSNHLLIASNDSPNIQIEELINLDANKVWSGDLEWARNYLQPVESHGYQPPVLESRLDADDGLHLKFIEHVQNEARQPLTTGQPWRIWCASRHLEWQHHIEWKQHVADSTLGGLIMLKVDACISTGLTIGYNFGVTVHDLPPIKHHQLHRLLPECSNDVSAGPLPPEPQSRCVTFLNLSPTVVRARTPTSAGMWNILWNSNNTHDTAYEKGALAQEAQQEKLWFITEARFGISSGMAKDLHDYLTAHMQAIAIDNLKGQCTQGHSCKPYSKLLLQQIIQNPSA